MDGNGTLRIVCPGSGKRWSWNAKAQKDTAPFIGLVKERLDIVHRFIPPGTVNLNIFDVALQIEKSFG